MNQRWIFIRKEASMKLHARILTPRVWLKCLGIVACGAMLVGARCQPRERFCTDINMTVTIGQGPQLIPNCVNNGPLQFEDREVVTFPGLTPEIATAEVPESAGFYAIQFSATAVANSGTVAVTLHDVPDPNFPRNGDDYTIHVTIIGAGPGQHGLVSIAVTPNPASVSVNQTLTFVATGHYSDGTTQDLTTTTNWAAAPLGIATISNSAGSQGAATGLTPGFTNITASAKDPITGADVFGSAILTVVAAAAPSLQSISITPNPASLLMNQSLQLTATGLYSDGTMQNLTNQASWSSSDPTVATVGNQGQGTQIGGLAMGVAPGSVTITANLSDPVTGTTITGTAPLTVTTQGPIVSLVLSAQPNPTGGATNLACMPQSGTGSPTWAWHGYRDDGTTDGVFFSSPNVEAPTATLSGNSAGLGTGFYLFCVVTESGGAYGSGYIYVTLSTGDTIASVAVSPSTIHAGATPVTLDATSSLNAQSPQWTVQYGGNITPNGIEGYLTIPQASWTTVFTDTSPTAPMVEIVPAAYFTAPGAYRVQIMVTSSNDFSQQVQTYYFQVVP
jgi:hypothetical protein